jgi:hypothetical protein
MATTTSKPLQCRLGVHSWENHRSDEGQRYVTCRQCGRDGDKITLNDYGDTRGPF